MDELTWRDIEIDVLETSSTSEKYVACCNGRHFEVSGAVADLITALQETDSPEAAAERLSSLRNKRYSEAEVKMLADKYIDPILNPKEPQPKRTFLIKRELVSAEGIGRLSGALKILFNKWIAILLLGIIIVFESLFFFHFNATFRFQEITPLIMVGILLFFICSSFFHELGHAAACRHFGVQHGGVGFGLYLNFPVFYTDVSGVWRLPRKQRLVVNIAGTYFQLIFLIPLFALYFMTYNDLIKYFIFTINLNFLFTLNPFFKFDGYWIMSDLLGVPNLRKRTNEMFRYLFDRLRHKPSQETPFLFAMKKTEKIFMIVYSAVVNLFFAYYFCYMLPKLLASFISTFPENAMELIRQLAMGQMPSFSLVRGIFTQLVFVALTAFLLYNLLKPFAIKVFALWKQRKMLTAETNNL